ncbi:MAG: tRNA (adenosine(37)-N6)-threonylcarbamoyltransferase complex ATPase subunit type 1 TsaE [Candidatus Paceibacterota bacterium]|jgi:tRNA threonylcarbamoyladenosine biosynthesis protein TsaE
MKETLIINQEDLRDLAKKVSDILMEQHSTEKLTRARIILLWGDLGSGKTTFTKVLAEVLGIDSNDVHSPTFILKKSYNAYHEMFTKLIHIDAYRFNHPSEAKVLRLGDDLKNPQNLIVIEWPSKMNYIKPDVEITFKIIDDYTREVTLSYDKE